MHKFGYIAIIILSSLLFSCQKEVITPRSMDVQAENSFNNSENIPTNDFDGDITDPNNDEDQNKKKKEQKN
ncbi:MAG: hypothetical protein ACI9XP_002092 [Lentimonas sp.]|jgi:hypothetical protein